MSKKNAKKQKNNPVEDVAVSQSAAENDTQAESVTEPTTRDVEATIDELALTKKRERIWEIDFVRGLMILFVVWDHFMWDVYFGFRTEYNTALFQWLQSVGEAYYYGTLRDVTHDVFVTLFVLTSGISCSFSRSNGKRAIKMCAFAILFSVVTYAIDAILGTKLTIYFNVIHVVALSVLIWTAIEWIWSKLTKNWQKNIFGVTMFAVIMTVLVVGYCAKHSCVIHGHTSNHWTNLIFGESEWRTNVIIKFRGGGDYLAFFPDFGWFLVGAFLGRVMYREKKSIFPSVNPKFVSPITFVGRHSLWVYFISQVVMYGFIYLLHGMFPIL